MLLLLLTACVDYNVSGKDTDVPAFDPGDTAGMPDTDTATDPPPEEECNGIDDDGDGLVDEGFSDADADGIADCLDDACTVDPPTPLEDHDDTCTGGVDYGTPPANPWNWTTEWSWSGGDVYSTPTVGDLDGDGVPEVVFTHAGASGSFWPGDLAVINGATGTLEWNLPGVVDASGGVALGDIDGDGYGDIVTYDYVGGVRTVAAYDRTGAAMWTSSTSAREENYAVITDLEGDGRVEVVANDEVLDGATGAVVATLATTGSTWGAPAVADLDGDGIQEIMLENRVYDSTGALIFQCGVGGTGSFPQPVNIDSDPEGEVLIAGYGQMTLCDDDGTVMWTRSYASYGTAVAVADFDNDGVQEYAFATINALQLIEPDGSTRWTTPINDASGLSGCTSWDIDLDGVPEVIYADEQDILVLNGADGTVEIRDSDHASVTLAETPAVADVDGDGQGELVYGSNGAPNDLTVIGSADGDWPYAKPVYNQYTYYGDNIGDDLSVPTDPLPPWIHPANIFRGQPSALYAAGTPNLKVAITDVCEASCTDGPAVVWVQVWNNGNQTVPAGAVVQLWGTVSGSQTLIESRPTSVDLAGGASEEMEFDTTTTWVGTELYAVVDPGNVVDECHEDDNTDTYDDLACP